MPTAGTWEGRRASALGRGIVAGLLAILLAGCGTATAAAAAGGGGEIDGGAVAPSDAFVDAPSMDGVAAAASAEGGDTACSAETCASGLSDDGYAFAWDGNTNGKDEMYALDAVRDADSEITGYRLYTTCQQNYEGDLPGVRIVREIGMSSDDTGPFLTVSYGGVDGSNGRCIVRVVDDNLDIVCG